VDLYHRSPIHLYGFVLNFNTETNLPLPYLTKKLYNYLYSYCGSADGRDILHALKVNAYKNMDGKPSAKSVDDSMM
jgi:hypothetical protein